jgi:hypothetical protein
VIKVSDLRKARYSVAVIYKEFLTRISKGLKFHVFIENHDDPLYYMMHLSSFGLDASKTVF